MNRRYGAFDLGRLPRVTFGPGRIAEVPRIVAGHGRHVLVVTGRRSLRETARFRALMDGLAGVGLAIEELAVDGEPSPDLVDEAVTTFRALSVDVVLGVGGGSVLDAAKAIAGLLRAETTSLDHLEGVGRGLAYEGPPTPFVAVPTTAGTGSEATRNAVLSRRGRNGFKKSFRDERLVARDAIVDPEMLAGMPPRLIADNGMDALAQLIESFTSTRASPFTDGVARAGLEAARDGLVAWHEAASTGSDAPEARAAMAFAALASGMTLAHTGLGAVHGLASPLGARHPIAHGAACGATLVAATRVNLEALSSRAADGQGLSRYAEIGRVLSDRGRLEDGAACEILVETLTAWAERVGVGGLSRFGVGVSDVPGLVAEARGTSMRTNPIKLTDAEVARILMESL